MDKDYYGLMRDTAEDWFCETDITKEQMLEQLAEMVECLERE